MSSSVAGLASLRYGAALQGTLHPADPAYDPWANDPDRTTRRETYTQETRMSQPAQDLIRHYVASVPGPVCPGCRAIAADVVHPSGEGDPAAGCVECGSKV